MAEGAILSAVLRVLHETIGSPLIKDFGLISGVNEELLKLQSTLTTIEAVLADAEERRVKDRALDNWLKKLRDAAYQADNVLDDFRIEALRREAETGNHILKKVRDFFSDSNMLIFKFRMSRKLKEVVDGLDLIARERQNFHLAVTERRDVRQTVIEERETVSSVVEPVIYGRDEDKEKIVKFLTTSVPNEDVLSVIAIVGMGGVGKTTLAQHAYNDALVKETFDIQMWVCVSEDFDVKRLTRLIVKSVSPTEPETGMESLEELHHRLQEKLSRKKFFLVLDDVWNETIDKWNTLRCFLQSGAKGSKIVVTTRIERIASKMGTVDNFFLKPLSEDDCWALFEKKAFCKKRKEEYLKLVSIGKEIVKKCDGLPLAAKALGSLMDSQETEDQWIAIRDNEIWQLPKEECNVIPGLMLSYYHLPSHLKPCFLYCSLFPKDNKIDENTLIWLWMAEGLIPSCNRSPHNIGKEYLKELVSRSLFQLDDFDFCYVHDLVHDLAKYVSGDAFIRTQAGGSIEVPQFCHHLTLLRDHNAVAYPKEFCQTETLRILLLLNKNWPPPPINRALREMFISLSKLRALHLEQYKIQEFPNSISNLKHLRYINLSEASIKTIPQSISSLRNLKILVLLYCQKLRSLPASLGGLLNLEVLQLGGCVNLQTLPESVTRLQKLDSLNLSQCWSLQALPMGLSNMKNLTNLDISYCDKLTHMPTEMVKMNRLQNLGAFIVDEEKGCSIAMLGHLNVGRELQILNLGKLKDPRVAREANLKEKRSIQSLSLHNNKRSYWPDDATIDDVNVEVLEGLEPPQNIVNLHMSGGTELPGWLKSITKSSFPKLIYVSLYRFKGCKLLPALGQLQHLQTLQIKAMDSIEVVGREFCGSNRDAAFPSLKSIEFRSMPIWKKWLSSEEEDGIIGQQALAFPCLTELNVYDCPELTSLPRLPSLQKLAVEKSMKLLKSARSLRGIRGNGSLKTLVISGNRSGGEDEGVMEGLWDLSSVEELTICSFDEMDCVMESMRHLFSTVQKLHIDDIRVLPETIGCLVSLQSLEIRNSHNLTSLGQGLQRLTALKDLDIHCCRDLGCMPEYMGSLTSLQSLSIWLCPNLWRRCEREKGEDWHLISHIPNIYIEPFPFEEEVTENPRSKKKGISVVKERLSACIPCSISST